MKLMLTAIGFGAINIPWALEWAPIEAYQGIPLTPDLHASAGLMLVVIGFFGLATIKG